MLDDINASQILKDRPVVVVELCVDQSSPNGFWKITNVLIILVLLLNVASIVLPAITPLWPPNIIEGVLLQCTMADTEIRSVASTRSTSGIINRVMDLQESAHQLCEDHDKAFHSGLLPYVRSWKGLYSKASALEAEIDDIEAIPEVRDLLRRRSAIKNQAAWTTNDMATGTNANMIALSLLSSPA